MNSITLQFFYTILENLCQVRGIGGPVPQRRVITQGDQDFALTLIGFRANLGVRDIDKRHVWRPLTQLTRFLVPSGPHLIFGDRRDKVCPRG